MDFTFKLISMISQMSHRYIFSDWNEKKVSSKEKKNLHLTTFPQTATATTPAFTSLRQRTKQILMYYPFIYEEKSSATGCINIAF